MLPVDSVFQFPVWWSGAFQVIAVFFALLKQQSEVQLIYTVQILIDGALQYYRFYGSEPTESNNPSGRYLQRSIQNPVSALSMPQVPLGGKGSLYRGHFT